MHRRKQHHLGHLVGAGDDETGGGSPGRALNYVKVAPMENEVSSATASRSFRRRTVGWLDALNAKTLVTYAHFGHS